MSLPYDNPTKAWSMLKSLQNKRRVNILHPDADESKNYIKLVLLSDTHNRHSKHVSCLFNFISCCLDSLFPMGMFFCILEISHFMETRGKTSELSINIWVHLYFTIIARFLIYSYFCIGYGFSLFHYYLQAHVQKNQHWGNIILNNFTFVF